MSQKQSFADLMRQQDEHEFAMSILQKEGYLDVKLVNKNVYQIDLHGLSAQHAVAELSSAYDDAMTKGLRRIRVITGSGTGRLIEAIGSLLSQWKQQNKIEAWSQTPNKGEFNFKF